jgi:hypothetical protein
MNQEVTMDELLNEAQRGRIVTVLRSLELDLAEARAALAAEPQEGILYHMRLSTPPDRCAAILAQVEAARTEIAALARKLDLPVTQQDPATQLAATFSVDWADLVDSRSATLRRYGTVNPRLAELIDEPLERLAGRASTIAHLFRPDGR